MKVRLFSLCVITGLFTACGGGGGSNTANENSTSSLSGKVIDGYLSAATVKVGSNTTTSDSTGSWSFNNIKVNEGDIISVTGGSDISTNESFDSNSTLKIVVPSDKSISLNISPISTIVAEIISAISSESLSNVQQTIATSLGLNLDTLSNDPVSMLGDANTLVQGQLALKAILQMQKISELYDSIPSAQKNDNTSGLSILATSLRSGSNISTSIETLNNKIIDADAKKSLELMKIQLDNISETSLTNSTSLSNLSRAIEVITSKVEDSLSTNNSSTALENAKLVSVTGLKQFVDEFDSNSSTDASDYATTFFGDASTKTNAISLYDKLEDLSTNTNVDLDTLLSSISTDANRNTVVNNAISNSDNTSYDMGTTLSDFSTSLNEITNSYNSNIVNGYYSQKVVYDGLTDAEFTVNLPNGTFYIFAEYSGTDNLIQSKIGSSSSIKDSDGDAVQNTTITESSLQTTSTTVAKLKIENLSTSVQSYVIPISAIKTGSNVASDIWVAAVNYDASEVTVNKTGLLTLGDVSSNTGLVLIENDTHTWQFTTGTNDEGIYDLEITTTNNSSENPLQYFSIELNEGTKEIANNSTLNGSIDVGNLSIKNSQEYTLTFEATSLRSDALGYYTIKLIKQ